MMTRSCREKGNGARVRSRFHTGAPPTTLLLHSTQRFTPAAAAAAAAAVLASRKGGEGGCLSHTLSRRFHQDLPGEGGERGH